MISEVNAVNSSWYMVQLRLKYIFNCTWCCCCCCCCDYYYKVAHPR